MSPNTCVYVDLDSFVCNILEMVKFFLQNNLFFGAEEATY